MNKKRTHLCILFGGRSCEHRVSVMSARSLLQEMECARYQLTLVGISRSGRWYLVQDPLAIFAKGEVSDEAGLPAVMLDYCGGRRLRRIANGAHLDGNVDGGVEGDGRNIGDESGDSFQGIDVVFPLLHGPCGEDGTVQGLLELANIPYIGCDVTASAVAMDKQMTKRVLRDQGLPQVDYMVVHGHLWQTTSRALLDEIEERFSWPVFVKPANMGSSVGITKVTKREALSDAIDEAMRFDTRVIIEKAAQGFRELECAVLGNEQPRVSTAGEIIPGREFYDYHTKYIDDKSRLIVPAPLSAKCAQRICNYARQAFLAVGCNGLARVDFFVSSDEQTIYVNEINTMPGFTRISMYPKLWQQDGLAYSRLIDELVQLALQRHRQRSRLQTVF